LYYSKTVIRKPERRIRDMAKRGRPFTYQSEDEKPVTVSLRLPRDVYDRVERYVKRHPGMTLTEFFLDGARLRLDTPADPRDLLLSDDNTVIQEIQEMIRAAVQAEIGKLSDFMGSRFSTPGDLPAPEAAELAEVLADAAVFLEDEDDEAMPAPEAPAPPVADLSYNGNTVLQEETPQRSTRRGGLKLTPQQEAALRAKRQQGASIKELMKEYGISKASVFRYLQ
jgi:hypothetical protein